MGYREHGAAACSRVAAYMISRNARFAFAWSRVGSLSSTCAGSQVVPASKGVAQGKLKPVARQLCPRGGEIECQRFSAPVAPDDLALGSAGLDIAEIRITPSEIERYRSLSDVATPVIKIHARLTRRAPGTSVVVFGNVMRVSSSSRRATPTPLPMNGLKGPSRGRPSLGRSTYAVSRPDREDKAAETDCCRVDSRKLA